MDLSNIQKLVLASQETCCISITKTAHSVLCKPREPHEKRTGQWRTEKFRSFDKAAFDCKLNGKCLVFLFQHPN